MNKVILVGNLVRDPELTTTTSGANVCRFSVAVSRKYANAEGKRDVDFLNIVVWNNLADNCHKYLKKGNKVGIVGNIQTRSYDAQDGSKRYVFEIVAEEVEFLSTKNSDSQGNEPQEEVTKLKPIEDDGLPF